jgi:hypothetical protein
VLILDAGFGGIYAALNVEQLLVRHSDLVWCPADNFHNKGLICHVNTHECHPAVQRYLTRVMGLVMV